MTDFFWSNLLPFGHDLLILVLFILSLIPLWIAIIDGPHDWYVEILRIQNVDYTQSTSRGPFKSEDLFAACLRPCLVGGLFFILFYLLAIPFLHRMWGWTFLWWGL